MRANRLFFGALVVALALLAASAAAGRARGAAGDGTLAVKDGRGGVVLNVKGSVIGWIDKGKLTIEDQDGDDGVPVVRGADWAKVLSESTVTYGGKGIRFRIFGGRFSVRIQNATGISLSVVARGRVQLKGAGLEELGLSNGTYSVNGDDALPIPDEPMWITLRAPGRPRP